MNKREQIILFYASTNTKCHQIRSEAEHQLCLETKRKPGAKINESSMSSKSNTKFIKRQGAYVLRVTSL